MKRPPKPKLPKGVRRRVLADGREVFDPLVKVAGKQKSLGACDTVDEAVAMRHAYFHKLTKAGEKVPRGTGADYLTVAQLGELCLTKEWDVDRWRARVLEMAEFAHWPATQVSSEHVQIWIDQMAHTPIKTGRGAGQLPTRGTLHSAISLLRRVYKWARMPARKYVTHNPVEGITIGNSTDAKPKSKRNLFDYLREAEVRQLLDAPRSVLPLEPRTKFITSTFSGARPSDVWRLRWERIDWDQESIQFTSAKTSKQEARNYVVYALPQLMAALREWHMACGRPTSGLVFPARERDGDAPAEPGEDVEVDETTGERIYARGYDAGWSDKRERRTKTVDGKRGSKKVRSLVVTEGYRTKVGIKRPVPLYSLRHTCACQLLLGGKLFTGGRMWSREEVQAQLGHLDSKATEFYLRALGILGKRAASESRVALELVRQESDDAKI